MEHANCFLSLSYIKLLFALHLQAAFVANTVHAIYILYCLEDEQILQ